MKKIIETKYGKIIGEENAKGVHFTSIPYAHTKRFTEPQPYYFDKDFDATEKQVNCPQRFQYVDKPSGYYVFYFNEFDRDRVSDYCEDYMTLSITTPKDAKDCPVIAYLHGGSFENGCVEDVPYGDSYVYADKGIIFVAIGYRLNVFGLYNSENYILKDQVFALKWIKENIASFGGDPNNVVLMGQSAGAMCINDLLLDKDLEGLFKGAIMLSGYGTIPKLVGPKKSSERKIKAFWDSVKQEAGCENYQQLLQVDSETLWRAWYKKRSNHPPMEVKAPALDGEIIKDVPQKILKQKLDINVPIMFGVVSQDMFPYMILDLGFNGALRKEKIGHKPVYGYFFNHTLPGNSYKCFHGCDLWYVFGNMDKCWRKFIEEDHQLSEMMIQYISNFVYNLDPNQDGLPIWKPISKKHQKLRLFQDEKQTEISRFKARLIFWHNLLKEKGPI